MKYFFINIILFTSVFLQPCELCVYLEKNSQEIFCEVNDRFRGLDIDENYYILLGKLEMISEIRKENFCGKTTISK